MIEWVNRAARQGGVVVGPGERSTCSRGGAEFRSPNLQDSIRRRMKTTSSLLLPTGVIAKELPSTANTPPHKADMEFRQ